jgi:hypothetical protein
MIIPFRKWLRRARAVAFFLVLTWFLYHVFQWMSDRLVPDTRFGEPDGRAIKANAVQAVAGGEAGFRERLRFFYWYGE